VKIKKTVKISFTYIIEADSQEGFDWALNDARINGGDYKLDERDSIYRCRTLPGLELGQLIDTTA